MSHRLDDCADLRGEMDDLLCAHDGEAVAASGLVHTAPGTRITQAVIMAGGKGTRLHPYSALFPKPLMPLNDMPVLELLLRQMKNAGITDVILAVNHLSHLLEAFFGNGERLGLNIRYRLESKPLGTAGALGDMLDDLDDDFFVTNGDLLTTLSLDRMMQAHYRSAGDISIGVYKREVKIDFGLIEIDQRSRLMAYREKPTSSHFVSMGVYALRREAVRMHLTSGEYLDMPGLIMSVKQSGGDVTCYHEDCVWLDIGRPDDFALAQQMFVSERNQFLAS
ncbi:sugar phosphate nucleotidyltransferase [Methylobacterium crusticola]|nr:sugar phosphate nucleotidyltransferase [Methylobacterium crusticola]